MLSIKKLLRKLEGIQTIESVKDRLNVNSTQASYYLSRLKKEGYVKTKRLSSNKNIYDISFENKLGGTSYYEIINKNSPIKLVILETYKIYGKKISLEETLIYAIKTKKLRVILASLALFKKISNWNELYRLSKKNHLKRQVGALYDLSREIMRVRKMSKRFRNLSLPQKNSKFNFIIPGLKSKDFKEIEKTWKIHIPFNHSDLEDYK